MPAISADSKVLLTGATGFLGAWILKTLLEEGFTVRATVRSQLKAEFLKARFSDHLNKLEFVIIEDITIPGAFDLAIQDVDGVIHAASPLAGPDPLIEPDLLIKPAVEGTLGVLNSARESSRVKRVVITSSIAACVDVQPNHTPVTFTERDWDDHAVDIVTLNGKDAPPFVKYAASKTLAERCAWKWMKETSPHFDMVTILPSFILGKIISETTADIRGSNARLLGPLKSSMLAKQDPDAMRAEFPTVDVRDVSMHHLLGLVVPLAGGERIISSNPTLPVQEFVNILHANPVEGITVPSAQKLDGWRAKISLSNEKSRSLGAQYRPIGETVRDTVVGALEVGWTQ